MNARASEADARQAVGQPYPIPLEEARADAALARRTLARLHRKRADLLNRVAGVEQEIAGCKTMLRVITGVYPELAEDALRQSALTEVPR